MRTYVLLHLLYGSRKIKHECPRTSDLASIERSSPFRGWSQPEHRTQSLSGGSVEVDSSNPFRVRRKSTIRHRDRVETQASRSSLVTRNASKSENEYFRSVPVPFASAILPTVIGQQDVINCFDDATVPMTATTHLAVSIALRNQIVESCARDQTKAFVAWLLEGFNQPDFRSIAARTANWEGADQHFQIVATLGFAADAGVSRNRSLRH